MRTVIRSLVFVVAAVMVACAMHFVLPAVGHAEPVTAGGGFYYTVRRGDTLSSIAKRYGVTTSAIVRANRIRNPSKIVAGQRLWIPGSKPAATPVPQKLNPTPAPPAQESPPSLLPTTRPSS